MSDEGLFVRFSLEPRIDQKATEEQGKPVWVNVEYIEIHTPGDRTNIPCRPVTAQDRERFAKRYEAWSRGQQDKLDGQPLKTWPGISPAEVNMLAQANIHTVEALAAVSDGNAGGIGQILGLRDKARRHLESTKAAAPLEALNARVEALQRDNEALSERLERALTALEEKGRAPLAETHAADSAPATAQSQQKSTSKQRGGQHTEATASKGA